MPQDTIAAISTPLGGEGAVGMIRISGPKALNITKKIFKPSNRSPQRTHTIRHGWIYGGKTNIDEVMVTYMKGPKTYTGDDTVEICCHGGSANVKNILEQAIRSGARLANRGEFTKRAFLSGKIDLAQAEAVIDLISAKTKDSAIMAASQLKGSLSAKIRAIRASLLELEAEIEAGVDFPDEIGEVPSKRAIKSIKNLSNILRQTIGSADKGKIFREGVLIAIIGRPNVGKSSLLNALLRQERALVHHEPGTTRDTIEETIDLGGVPARIVDTAGVRRSRNEIESKGIVKTINAINDADIVIIVLDGSEMIKKEDKEIIAKTRENKGIVVLNKADKKQKLKPINIKRLAQGKKIITGISATSGEGIGRLEKSIIKEIGVNKILARDTDVMINLRHKECLVRANESLKRAEISIKTRMSQDLVSIDIKDAIVALGEVTGEAVSEEVIGAIFERFCVGK